MGNPGCATERSFVSADGGPLAFFATRRCQLRRGCATKNFHKMSFAEMENVVFPTTLAIAFENALPGHEWPPPVTT
jgi:hypothetical protein